MIRAANLIISDEARRGRGTEDDPVRAICQVWTEDGRLLAEVDFRDATRPAWVGLLADVPATWQATR